MDTQPPGRTIRLKDGRFLGYAEFGDPQGRPGFYFHGFPGSRLEAKLAHEAAKAAGVRIIALDRPGMGLSDFERGRTLLDWPENVLEAADALGIERFAVMGLSGGGPYAAACAFKIPERLISAGIISGVGPFDVRDATKGMMMPNRVIFRLGRYLPFLSRPVLLLMSRQARNPENFVRQAERWAAPPDRPILRRPEVREVYLADIPEAYRRGSRGPARELVLYTRPWGFRLGDVAMPVHLWQGEADRNVPISMGQYMAHAIPNCHATFYAGEGHLFLVDRMPEILSALMSPT